MKKFLSVFMLIMTMICTQYVLVGCDKDDNDDYYAGESADDFRPMTYTITSEWDLSNVAGLTASDRERFEAELESSVNTSQVFDTRVDAVAAFDAIVNEMKTSPDIDLPGMKAKLYLRRGSAIIKSASITW